MATLLAVHGALMQPEVLRAFTRACRVDAILPGLPAHPGGPAWDATRDYHDQAYETVLGQLPEAPIHLFGHSLGGTVALRVALKHPDRVASLTLFEPVLFAAATPAARAHHFDVEMAEFARAYEADDHATAARLFNRFWGTGTRWEALPGPVRRMLTRLIPVVPATRAAIVDDGPGLLPRLSACPVPTRVFRSVHAPEIVASISSGICDRMPKASEMTVAGNGGHMMPAIDPEALGTAVKDFWAQLPR